MKLEAVSMGQGLGEMNQLHKDKQLLTLFKNKNKNKRSPTWIILRSKSARARVGVEA